MKNVIILFFLTMVINKALCQSITIQPNDFNSSLNSNKIGLNTIKIEGKKFTDNFNFIDTNGSANLKLLGNPNFLDPSSGSSNNTIDFYMVTILGGQLEISSVEIFYMKQMVSGFGI